MDTAEDCAQLPLHFVDRLQWRYAVIRPLILCADRTPKQRAEETQTPIETVRDLLRRFHRQGLLGLVPDDGAIVPKGKTTRVPQAVVDDLARLKALDTGCQYRELARIIFCKVGDRLHHQTVKKLWQDSPEAVPGEWALGAYHSHAEPYQARGQVIKLYYQGWTKRRISPVLHGSRPTVDRGIRRFEAAQFAGLEDKSRAPKAPARQVWLPLRIDVYHWQKRPPDAGECRLWSLLARTDISVRPVGRIMALKKQVDAAIPHVHTKAAPKSPQPHPYKATAPHQVWCIDGRMMDFALDGVKWWSRIRLEGYSRTMLAGAVAPAEASWVALMVLYTACLRSGAPETVISDSGGAFISTACKAVCKRLGIHQEPIKSNKGQSYVNWMETHCNIPRRLFDYQLA